METIGEIIDSKRITPFFFSLSISSNKEVFNKVILASLSTTMKSGQTNGLLLSSSLSSLS
jgi:hypothetical protein